MGGTAPKWHIEVTCDRQDKKKFFMRVVDGDKDVVMSLSFNEPGYVFSVSLLEISKMIEVTRFQSSRPTKELATYSLQLGMAAKAKKACILFNRICDIVQEMPLEIIRCTNIPRPLPGRIPSYNLPSGHTNDARPNDPMPDSQAVWKMGNGFQAVFTGFLITGTSNDLWLKQTGRASPSDEKAPALPAAAAASNDDDDDGNDKN